MSAVILPGTFGDPNESRLAQCGGAAFRLAIARKYCKTVARGFAKKAKEAARRCAWRTPDEIAESVVPHSNQSATVRSPPPPKGAA